MTLTQGDTRVRHLINQTSTTNTLFDSTEFIAKVLNQGRRLFASILPEDKLPKLRKSVTLSNSTNGVTVGDYPTDFLRKVEQPYVTINSIVAVRIPDQERWRLRFLESNDLIKSGASQYYYWERSDGVYFLPNSDVAVVYEYLKYPDDLGVSDNVELPPDVDDLVVDFAFKKCMGTTRGNLELATFLAREQGLIIGAKQ